MRLLRLLAAIVAALALAGTTAAATVPTDVLDAVHGRVAGWARSGSSWFVVYLDRRGSGWCGLDGASWRFALVRTQPLPDRIVTDRRLGAAMCGNSLAWVRAGRFTDGIHADVAFMLWATPSIGATTSVYRIDGTRLRLVRTFGGDRVVLGRGVATITFENRGRSRHGELKDVYRFENGRYRLVSRT
jgi:hypothetical protein